MAEKARLDTMLLQVGNMAKASAPAVVSRPVLPDRYPGFLQKWFFEVRPFVRIAVPALLVLVIITVALVLKPGQDMRIAFVEEQMIDPEQLLFDIDRLIENPLPQELQSMVSFTEIDSDEDFMEYIVPVTENDPCPTYQERKEKTYVETYFDRDDCHYDGLYIFGSGCSRKCRRVQKS